MADTVNLFGHPVKKGWVIGGGVVAGAVVIYYVRKQQAASAASTAASSSAPTGPTAAGDPYPPDGTTGNPSDPYSTDPATGQTYGNEANGGYVGTGASNLGGYYGNTSLYGAGTGYEQPGSFTSNAYWSQYVEQLMGSSGNDAISQAIGAYVTGAPVTSAGVSIIEQAIAVAGYPPVSGTNGYPPSINSGSSGATATVTVPDVTGQTLTAAQAAITAAGLSYSGPSGSGTVASQSPAPGTQVPAGSAVAVTEQASAPPPSPPPAQPPPSQPTSPPPAQQQPAPAPRQQAAPHPPAAPSRIDISGTTPTSISCHWTDVPGATSYQVQVTYQSRTVRSFTAGSYSTVISGLTPDHTYGVHVSSVGPGGTSQPAATWAKTPR